RLQDVPPLGSGGDRRGAGGGVDGDVGHPGGADQQPVVDGEVGAVAGGLHGDGGAGGRGPAQRGDDVVGAGRADDDVRRVQGGEVEAGDLVGVAVLAGAQDRAVDLREGEQVGGGGHRVLRGGRTEGR